MISRVKINKKIKEWISLFKKFIIYQLEQVFRESDDCKIIVIGDCTDAGISNVDMDLTFFTISILRNYYPMILKSILVYELPWVLNYVVKLVYSLLAEDFKQLIHLIKKKELNNYIDQNQLPDFLDGTCELSYKTAPKGVQSARVLGHQLKISESAIDKLIKHLEPYILGDQTTI